MSSNPDISQSLKTRVLRAGGWMLVGWGVQQTIRFGSNLLMTRLLVPEMFGVMAIANMTMVGLAMFSDVGLKQGLVQSKRGNDSTYYNTAWVLQILRGALLWSGGLVASVALYIANGSGLMPEASVYASPILPYVIAIISTSAFISGFESTKSSMASRNLALGSLVRIEIISQIAALVCMLAWVAVDRSIWVLVSGYLVSVTTRMILTHLYLAGEKNRWQWDRDAFKEIIGFGKWIFLSSILGFLINSGDRLLLGGLLTSSELGIYVIAVMIYEAITMILSKAITDIAFPALSEIIREQPDKLKSGYYRLYSAFALPSYFGAGFLMTAGYSLISLFYDARYADAGWMLQILGLSLAATPNRIPEQCFLALGMPRLFSILITARLVALYSLIPLGFHFFGTAGAIAGLTLSHFSKFPVTFFYAKKYDIFDLRKELRPVVWLPVGAIIGYLISLLIGSLMSG